MKLKHTLFLILIMLSASHLSPVFAFSEQNDQEQRKLAAKLLMSVSADKMVERDIPKDLIYNHITENKENHKNVDDSRDECLEFLKHNFQNDFKVSSENIFKNLNLNKSEKNWCDALYKNLLDKQQPLMEQNITQKFELAFLNDRTKAVLEQRKIIKKYAKPMSEEDFIKIENGDETLKNTLFKRTIDQYKEAFFSENITNMDERIDAIFQDAVDQFKSQLTLVGISTGGNIQNRTISSIRSFIFKELEIFRSGKTDAYPIFPSVLKKTEKKCQALAISKFLNFLPAWDYQISGDRLIETISSDIEQHLDFLQSQKFILKKFKEEITEKVLSEYTKDISNDEKVSLKNFLHSNSSCMNAIDEVLPKSVSRLSEVRKKISERQFKNFFPEIYDASYTPTPKIIETYASGTDAEKRRITADIAKKLKQEKPLLDETENLLKNALDKRFQRGEDAILDQFKLVDNFEKIMKKDESALIRFFQKHSSEELENNNCIPLCVEIVIKDIGAKWKNNRLSAVYSDLFGTVESRIEAVVKALLLKEMKKRKEVIAEHKRIENDSGQPNSNSSPSTHSYIKSNQNGVPSNQPPGNRFNNGEKGYSRSGDGDGDGGGKYKKGINIFTADILINLSLQNDGKINVIYIIKKQSQFLRTYDFQSLSKNIKDRLLNDIQAEFTAYFKEAIKKENASLIYILAQVQDEKIPYGFVFIVRETVRDILGTFKEKKPHLKWYDGYLPDKEGGDEFPVGGKILFWSLGSN